MKLEFLNSLNIIWYLLYIPNHWFCIPFKRRHILHRL
ncbi:unnamed protein product [Paramecium octaurelia]|uniref:Uncharacterized protein n=1 Tax=Paramecium octaurelia TaxID=43137 RepID=A0A8S1W0L2_PAROT|nr:unnamed protein product [Paramecium octaurelia]